MGKQKGKDWRIHVGDGVEPEVFTALGGETSFTWQRQSQENDQSSKDDGQYGSSFFGQQKITFQVSGVLTLPDTALEQIADVAKSTTPELNIKVMAGAVEKFAGAVGVGNFSCEFPREGAATYSFTMVNAGVPTTDDLGASV